jgi:putative nucleotidyltransferase with HDIG domain
MGSMSPSTVPYELDIRIVELIRDNRVEVPPYPAVAMKLQELLLGGTDYGAGDLVEIISADQALAASVLRYVNSPALRAAAPITSLRAAVARLGKRDLLGLALAVGIGDAMLGRVTGLLPLKRMVWRNALFCAELCHNLAGRRGMAEDEAFTCGLLHDFGKMVAISCLEQIVGENKEGRRLSGARCLEVVDTYHVELGAIVAERWNLPDVVGEVVRTHHEPGTASRHRRVVDLVAATDEVIALVDSLPAVTPSDLEAVSYLHTVAERALVSDMVVALPATAKAFEPESAETPRIKRRQSTLLERPRTTIEGVRLPWIVDFPTICVTLSGPMEYRTTYITSSGIGMRGPERLQEQLLVQLHLMPPNYEPLDLWATITLCVEESPGFRLELQPVALDRPTNDRWQRLVADLEVATKTTS